MTKIIVDREVLHQMARRLLGTAEVLPTVVAHKMADAARRIADATAVPENGPCEIVAE